MPHHWGCSILVWIGSWAADLLPDVVGGNSVPMARCLMLGIRFLRLLTTQAILLNLVLRKGFWQLLFYLQLPILYPFSIPNKIVRGISKKKSPFDASISREIVLPYIQTSRCVRLNCYCGIFMTMIKNIICYICAYDFILVLHFRIRLYYLFSVVWYQIPISFAWF